ncbi:MAG: YfhO family protein [Lentimicrobiaceae bacterium]|nr:YfhO family protein [Lentimicrobiaceae bacterium]
MEKLRYSQWASMIYRKVFQHRYVFGLLLVAVAAYFPMFKYLPIYDYADEFFPSCYFIIDSLRNGILPFWNPYQTMGLPIHGDPQSAVFYFPNWLFVVFSNYPPYYWSLYFMLHAFVGGLGFYLLSKHFVQENIAAFAVACAYMLSGVYVGNAQHLSWIIAVAWIPWVLYTLLNLIKNPCFKTCLALALSASLLFVGGYTGFVFVLIYLCIALLVWTIIRSVYKKEYQYIKKTILWSLLSVCCFVLLSLPAVISYIEAVIYTVRGTKLVYERACAGLFTVQSLISLICPYLSTNPNFIKTDQSMANIYMGIATLFFFCFGIFKAKNPLLILISIFGCFCFLVSFGNYFPFHKFGFDYFPLWNMIRVPSMFRLFFIISVLLIAAVGAEYFKKWISKPYFFYALVVFLLFDLVVNTQICGRKTAFNTSTTNRQFSQILKTAPKDYPIPEKLTSSEEIYANKNYHSFWRNLGIYEKKIEWDSYNPFILKSYDKMLQFYYQNEEKLILPVVFFPKVIMQDTNSRRLSTDTAFCENNKHIGNFDDAESTVKLQQFVPGRIEFHAESNKKRPLVITQNFYKGWKAETSQGIALEITPINSSMTAVWIPQGKHQISLYYHRPDIKYSLFLMFGGYLFVFFSLTYSFIRNF